jgi:hypothetical protein
VVGAQVRESPPAAAEDAAVAPAEEAAEAVHPLSCDVTAICGGEAREKRFTDIGTSP